MNTTITAQQVLDAIRNKDRGVQYNKDNKENKENKDNILSMNNWVSPGSLGLEAYASLDPELDCVVSGQQEEAEHLDSSPSGTLPSTPPLTFENVNSTIVQLFDNGENSSQRYKIKVRLNLTDGENPEFVASLTKDRRNFKKYIPEECREEITQMADEERKRIKALTGSYPYIGKFHFNQGVSTRSHRTEVEPYTLAVVWYNPEDKGWSCIVRLYDWAVELDLFSEHLTDKQKKSNVKAQATWQHPRMTKINRPKTWAEQRRIK